MQKNPLTPKNFYKSNMYCAPHTTKSSVAVLMALLTDSFQETPTVILTRPIPSKESHKDEESTSLVLAKLLSLDDVNTSDRKQKPGAFSAALAKSSYEPKFHPDDKTKKTKQGKIRVRRQRCYPPFFQCSLQPTGSSRKRVLPQRGNKNL